MQTTKTIIIFSLFLKKNLPMLCIENNLFSFETSPKLPLPSIMLVMKLKTYFLIISNRSYFAILKQSRVMATFGKV